MASIANDPNGYRRLLFLGPDGRRKTIRLGRVSDRDADRIKVHVEHLVTAAKNRTQLDPDTTAWLSRIGNDLAAKLAAAGLVSARRTSTAALAQYIQDYRAHRADVAEGTNTNYGIVGARLLAFFPSDRALHAITEGEADRWLVWLKTEYAGPTVSKSIKIARQLWAQAIRDGLASTNPFAHLRTPSEVNTARAFFVDRATFGRVLAACPDPEWRLLLALARYGGLRTPSEPLSLEWADVNWERQRFRVVAPKTKHEDGGERWVPLFPELLPYLEEAFDRAEPGAVNIITRCRDAKVNLRTQLGRIVRRAGVKLWPRPFQNLRASRETELAETFPIHVAADWLGNSPKTALAHYTQVTEQHYLQAVKEGAAHKAAQQGTAEPRTEPQALGREMAESDTVRDLATPCDNLLHCGVTPTGFEPVSQP